MAEQESIGNVLSDEEIGDVSGGMKIVVVKGSKNLVSEESAKISETDKELKNPIFIRTGVDMQLYSR